MQFLLFAVSLFVGLVSAEIAFNVPSDIQTNGEVTITWTHVPGQDPPTFSMYLFNEAFNDNFGIANNLDTSIGSHTLQLPVVPVTGGYTIRAVNPGNINEVYGESSTFSIAANDESTSATATSTSGSQSSTSNTQTSTSESESESATSTPNTSTSQTGPVTRPNTSTGDDEPTQSPNPDENEEGGAKSVTASYGAFAVAVIGAALGSVFAL